MPPGYRARRPGPRSGWARAAASSPEPGADDRRHGPARLGADAEPHGAEVRAAEVELGHQVADGRPVRRDVDAPGRVRQVVLAVAGERGQAPVGLDELED